MNFKLIFILTLIGLAVLFGVQNVAVVEIQFLLWSFTLARSILIFFVLAAGIIIGWLMHSYTDYKERHKTEQAPSKPAGIEDDRKDLNSF
ncbi:MAG: LapA family protein [Proteobacteria bacterium]|nr:LapA family protein [Pseudomonadota bacterium]MBU1736951.1 LapA family protein [Pseudomonadota bacterium]